VGLRRILAQLASGGPAPVFPLLGAGAASLERVLRLDSRLRVVDSPRAANILFVGGEVTAGLLRPVVAMHDMMSHPRATVWAPLEAPTRRLQKVFPDVTLLNPEDDVVAEVARIHGELLSDRRKSERGVLPERDAAPWRDVGPYGQGGTGMTGGVPYGRPMATRAPDRDGLELDKLDLRVGPFFPPLPRGLVLDVQLQGDVIQKALVSTNPFRRVRSRLPGDVFRAALAGPVPIEEIELARARHHLKWLAGMLRVHGLAALSFRALALSRDLSLRSASAVRELGQLLERTRGLGWATAGVGVLPHATAGAATGPVARAAGYEVDARLQDPGYRELEFTPVVQHEGDARARWRQRIAEAVQGVELAARAGDRHTGSLDQVEGPRGVLGPFGSSWETLVGELPTILEGQEWGDAITTLVSLDLDMEGSP